MELGYNRGAVEAPLKVIEFSDFGCGFCRRFHQESFPTLKEQFIDTRMIATVRSLTAARSAWVSSEKPLSVTRSVTARRTPPAIATVAA